MPNVQSFISRVDVAGLIARMETLKEEFVMSSQGMAEHVVKLSMLFQMIDEARAPVADKALEMWNGYGSEWLKLATVDEIMLRGSVPFFFAGGAVYLSDAILDPARFTVKTSLTEKGWPYVSGLGIGVDPADYLSSCISETALGADLLSKIKSQSAVVNLTVNVSGGGDPEKIGESCRQYLMDQLYPDRELCANAAQWLVMTGALIGAAKSTATKWLGMGEVHSAAWIIETAEDHLEAYNAKRLPVADTARDLWINHGYKASQTFSYRDGEVILSGFEKPKRAATLIVVDRLGTGGGGAKVVILFFKQGRLLSTHEIDEARVIGDADVKIEAVYE